MAKTILAALGVVLISAQVASAQAAKVPEWFIGYANLQAQGLPASNTGGGVFDTEFFNDRGTLQGANVEFSGFDISGLGMTADVSFTTQRKNTDVTTRHTDVWYFLVGPSMKWNRPHGKTPIEPFIRIMAGAAHTRFAGTFTTVTGGTTGTASTTDFALAGGGGIDIRLHSVKIRIIQVDYAPIFLGSSSLSVLSSSGAVTAAAIDNQRLDNVRFAWGISF